MKSINKYQNILNIVIILIYLVLGVAFNFIYLYKTYIIILRALLYFGLGLNIICGIVNLIKHNKVFGVLSIITGIISFPILIIKYTDLKYELEDGVIGVIIIVIFAIISILSIINLIINRKIEDNNKRKLPLILTLAFFIFINIVLIILAYIKHSDNVSKFENALSLMENEKNTVTYIVNEFNSQNKEYIFIDKDGNEIRRIKYDENIRFKYYFLLNNKPVHLAYTKINGKDSLINSIGEEIFSIDEDIDDFIQYIIMTGKYNIRRVSSSYYNEITNNNLIKINYNMLEGYQERSKKYEDNNSYKYIYFKNPEFMQNKVLQVVIKNEKETDNKLLDMYEEFCEYELDSDSMNNYYNYKKEFYLINFNNNSKVKLECNNLIYEARFYDEDIVENIILASDGSLLFYDEAETGYFNKDGSKVVLNSAYLIYDVTDKYVFVNEKSTGKTYILSSQTGQTIKTFDNTLIKYNGFYISYPNTDNGTYDLMDKDLNVLVTSETEPEFIGKKLINITDLDYNSYIYYYDNEDIKKLYYSEQSLYNATTSEEENIISSNIYSNLGILGITK